MQTKVQKWGNSLAVRIPKPFVKETRLAYGASIDLSVIDGKIIIDPTIEPDFTLDDILKGINKRNLHTGVDTGNAVGREVW